MTELSMHQLKPVGDDHRDRSSPSFRQRTWEEHSNQVRFAPILAVLAAWRCAANRTFVQKAAFCLIP
jgi:hypothetical protein